MLQSVMQCGTLGRLLALRTIPSYMSRNRRKALCYVEQHQTKGAEQVLDKSSENMIKED